MIAIHRRQAWRRWRPIWRRWDEGKSPIWPPNGAETPMKIHLLSPAGEIHRNGTGIFKTSLRYAPLTLSTLAAMVPDELNAEITLQDEGVQPLDLNMDADLVGITAITGTSLRA